MSANFPESSPADYFPPIIKWRDDIADEPSTPFGDGSDFPRNCKTRPLRVTLDVSALTSPDHRAVAQAFFEFRESSLLALRINDPRLPGGVSVPAITDDLPGHHYLHVQVQEAGRTFNVNLMTVGEMKDILDRYGLQGSRAQLALASFHQGWRGDLLVTADLALHELAKRVGYLGLNVVTPTVGLRLFGLLLRYHEKFIIRAKPNFIIGRWPFYWSLARQRLPGFWRYFSACQDCSDKTIGRAAGSILHRAARALEARDFVGYENYGPASHDSADRSAYHFDYLLLLLTGALDAMALVARTAYGIQVRNRDASFRRDAFRKHLATAGAQSILDWLDLQTNADTLGVLYDLRNLIHGAGLQHVQGALFEIPSDLKPLIPKIRQICPDTTCVSRNGTYLKHYPLALALAERTLSIMDGIAERTDVPRLLPPGKTLPAACLTVPRDDLFSGPQAERISALG